MTRTTVRADKQTRSQVQHRLFTETKAQEALEISVKNNYDKKNPDEPYQDLLIFWQTGEVFLWKSNKNEISVPIGLSSLQMRTIISLYHLVTNPIVIKAATQNFTGWTLPTSAARGNLGFVRYNGKTV